jgi:hypothetical protein
MKKIISLSIYFLLGAALCNAQKLPKIQEESDRAPVNIKIDGRTDDWGNQFKAYNPGAAIFYSVANDDQNLYLVLQVKEPTVIKTIIGYGFEFSLQKPDSKNNRTKVIISYPVFEHIAGNRPVVITVPQQPDTNAVQRTADLNNRNSLLAQKFKTIGTMGITGLDTLSVYNDQGIKAASRFDENYAYTIELAVPLKYLKDIITENQPFFYNLSCNGFYSNAIPRGSSPDYMAGWNAANADISKKYPHYDFWGKYTLAKK